MSTIPAGYQVQITTWENDGDHYKTQVISGLDLVHAKGMIALAKMFVSRHGKPYGYGNDSISQRDFEDIIDMLGDEFPHLKKFTSRDQFYGSLMGILGSPVECEDDYFCRVYYGHTVYYFPVAVEEANI